MRTLHACQGELHDTPGTAEPGVIYERALQLEWRRCMRRSADVPGPGNYGEGSYRDPYKPLKDKYWLYGDVELPEEDVIHLETLEEEEEPPQ